MKFKPLKTPACREISLQETLDYMEKQLFLAMMVPIGYVPALALRRAWDKHLEMIREKNGQPRKKQAD